MASSSPIIINKGRILLPPTNKKKVGLHACVHLILQHLGYSAQGLHAELWHPLAEEAFSSTFNCGKYEGRVFFFFFAVNMIPSLYLTTSTVEPPPPPKKKDRAARER